MTPEIAIIGHPNEGKSSVLSTLAEDDSVRVSPFPGETTRCRTFPITIDGKEILRFTDTPGFQNPGRLLAVLKSSSTSGSARLKQLLDLTSDNPEFQEDHELLQPLSRGAGVIYVADGSRPLRQIDQAEMNVLRLIGRPRMAVLNCKEDQQHYLQQWKDELAQHFNSWRLFNAHRATYAERIALLEALKAIDQDWQPILATVVTAFISDWARRTERTADIICSLLTDTLSLQLNKPCRPQDNETAIRETLLELYTKTVATLERTAQQQIRELFKHNIFNCELPPYSILHENLTSERNWQLLGLSGKQLLTLGSLSGAAVGAGIDVAALGHGLGLFTALGAAAGMTSALLSRRHLRTTASLLGLRLAGTTLEIGPAKEISLLFVLINRQLLFFKHIINWAHGRRDADSSVILESSPAQNTFTRNWSKAELQVCQAFFRAVRHSNGVPIDPAVFEAMQKLLCATLLRISHD